MNSEPEATYQLVAKTFQGLENILASELTELGAENIEIGRRMVAFTGDKATAEVVSGLIMQGAAVVAYIIGEGLADAANAPSNKDD